jgi:membrane associated rhomboid family serine protease
MPNETLSRARYWWSEGSYPLTKAMILINIATLLLSAFQPAFVTQLLQFQAPESLTRPWTLLTYPLVARDPIQLLFYGLVMWWVGGSLERSWGTKFFAVYCAVISVITALGISLGALLVNHTIFLDNWLTLSALIVAWCMLNPNQEIRLYGIIPILAKWLAVGTALIILFTYGRSHFALGLCALVGCAASFWWVRTRAWNDVSLYSSMPVAPRPSRASRPKRPRRDDDFSWKDLNPIERIKRARRKKQFERLMKDD